MHTIERIYPKDLDPHSSDDQNTLRIHMERYEFAAQHLSGACVLDMACGCGYGTALLAERHRAPRLRGPFNLDARRAAGFDEVELGLLG